MAGFPVTSSAPIDALGKRYLSGLKRFFELWRKLIDAGVLTRKTSRPISPWRIKPCGWRSLPVARLRNAPACARERGSATDRNAARVPEGGGRPRELLALESSPCLAPPARWYRGSVRWDVLEIPVLQAALDNLAT